MTPAEIVYYSVHDQVTVTLEHFKVITKDWIFIQTGPGEAVAIKGNQIHYGRLPHRQKSYIHRDKLNEILGSLLKKYSSVVTHTIKDDPISNRFVARLGFKQTGTAEPGMIEHTLVESKYVRD